MTKRVFRLPSEDPPFLDIFSGGRHGPRGSGGFSLEQIEQIRRTVRRAPEVMVKVTGGGRKAGAVAAHFAYISQQGKLDLETDDGQGISKAGQKDLLTGWHLELSAGQYRQARDGNSRPPGVKLVHNITLSMPAPTPPEAVLAAAKAFAREKFGLKHRYAMALHTHQEHPHVHLVVKAENEDGGGRLHIDKATLREWREDFARMMRDQGVDANATPRAVRGQGKRAARAATYRAKGRRNSYAMRAAVQSIAAELTRTRRIHDPAHSRLAKTRQSIVAGWMDVAAKLDAQGELILAGDVRYFAKHLPPVLTDRERLAADFIHYIKAQRAERTWGDDRARDRTLERTR